MNANDKFEQLAEQFHKDTGYLAPGKDDMSNASEEKRHQAWEEWLDRRKNKHAQQLGKLGGQVKSEAKTKAVRENGKLGGRPVKHVHKLEFMGGVYESDILPRLKCVGFPAFRRNMTDLFICPDGHDCTSDCRRNGCPCLEDHIHPERGDEEE